MSFNILLLSKLFGLAASGSKKNSSFFAKNGISLTILLCIIFKDSSNSIFKLFTNNSNQRKKTRGSTYILWPEKIERYYKII